MIQEIIGYIFIIFGVISSSGGVIAMYKFRGLYKKILVSGNIDTVFVLFTMIGALFLAPDYTYTLKIIFIMILVFVTTPLSSHAIIRSAYYSGYRE